MQGFITNPTLINTQPYKYGHAFEVKPLDTKGGATINKWYTMGRHSYEMWYVCLLHVVCMFVCVCVCTCVCALLLCLCTP